MSFLLWPIRTLYKYDVRPAEASVAILILFLAGFAVSGTFTWFAVIQPKSIWVILGLMGGAITAAQGAVLYFANKLNKPSLVNLILPLCLLVVFITVMLIASPGA